ncbi:MAG: transglutaminase-like domain-containing protein [Dorea sp.]|nr:transglutaminase-like domain-containing protein [Dorea sp.]
MKALKKSLALVFMSLALVFAATVVVNTASPVTVQAATPTKAQLQKKCDTIIEKQTKPEDSKTAKLKKLFNYMRKTCKYGNCATHPNYKVPKATDTKWHIAYGYETLTKKTGDCYHFAAAYAALAERATGLKTRIVTGTTTGFDSKRKTSQKHAWVEVAISGKWYIYDVNMDLYGKTTKNKANPAYTCYKLLRTDAAVKKLYGSYKGITNFAVDL